MSRNKSRISEEDVKVVLKLWKYNWFNVNGNLKTFIGSGINLFFPNLNQTILTGLNPGSKKCTLKISPSLPLPSASCAHRILNQSTLSSPLLTDPPLPCWLHLLAEYTYLQLPICIAVTFVQIMQFLFYDILKNLEKFQLPSSNCIVYVEADNVGQCTGTMCWDNVLGQCAGTMCWQCGKL